MSYMHPGTETWLDAIGAGAAKLRLSSAMQNTKQRAENDGVIYKSEEPEMDTQVVEGVEVKAETVAEVVEVKDETIAEDVEVKAETVAEDVEVKDETVAEDVEVKDETVAEDVEVKDETVAEVKEETPAPDMVKAYAEFAESVQKGFADVAETVVELNKEIAALKAELADLKSTSVKSESDNFFAVPKLSFQSLVEEKSQSFVEVDDALVEKLLNESPEESENVADHSGPAPFFSF